MERKERYANYLDDPQHLDIAVTARANRSKGAKGLERWPEDRTYWCRYSIDWVTIKSTWDLTITESEHAALAEMLNTCANPPVLMTSEGRRTDVTPGPTSTPVAPPTAAPAAVYRSCDAAQAAGETRVQDSQGSGRGFPQWMVLRQA